MQRPLPLFFVVQALVSPFVAGCGGGEIEPSSVLYPPPVCSVDVATHADEGGQHVPSCSKVTYGTNPPSSGSHYPVWSAFKRYTAPVPRGFVVHNLEHGAMVVSYRPDVSAADVDAIARWADALPDDPDCPERRLVITPDPLLDVPFAAAAWGVTLRAACFDAPQFTRFFRDHVGHAPEQVCAGGADLTQSMPGCGE